MSLVKDYREHFLVSSKIENLPAPSHQAKVVKSRIAKGSSNQVVDVQFTTN